MHKKPLSRLFKVLKNIFENKYENNTIKKFSCIIFERITKKKRVNKQYIFILKHYDKTVHIIHSHTHIYIKQIHQYIIF